MLNKLQLVHLVGSIRDLADVTDTTTERELRFKIDQIRVFADCALSLFDGKEATVVKANTSDDEINGFVQDQQNLSMTDKQKLFGALMRYRDQKIAKKNKETNQ